MKHFPSIRKQNGAQDRDVLMDTARQHERFRADGRDLRSSMLAQDPGY